MSKYIDAEKLIAKIQPHYENARCKARYAQETGTSSDCTKWFKAKEIYEHILRIISSLQQEQPEVDLEKELKNLLKSGDNGCSALDIARHFWNKGYIAGKEE